MTANTVQVALATMYKQCFEQAGHGVGTKVLSTNCMTVHPTYSGNKGKPISGSLTYYFTKEAYKLYDTVCMYLWMNVFFSEVNTVDDTGGQK